VTLTLIGAPAWMFAHVPPWYWVAASTLNTYELIMKRSVGHEVPETTAVTVIVVAVDTGPRGSICSRETVKTPPGAAVTCGLDGAVITLRSDPHAISGNTPSAAAATAKNVRAFLTMPTPRKIAGYS
jgi:hypothetical protein